MKPADEVTRFDKFLEWLFAVLLLSGIVVGGLALATCDACTDEDAPDVDPFIDIPP